MVWQRSGHKPPTISCVVSATKIPRDVRAKCLNPTGACDRLAVSEYEGCQKLGTLSQELGAHEAVRIV
jgi:hypothetical protein